MVAANYHDTEGKAILLISAPFEQQKYDEYGYQPEIGGDTLRVE